MYVYRLIFLFSKLPYYLVRCPSYVAVYFSLLLSNGISYCVFYYSPPLLLFLCTVRHTHYPPVATFKPFFPHVHFCLQSTVFSMSRVLSSPRSKLLSVHKYSPCLLFLHIIPILVSSHHFITAFIFVEARRLVRSQTQLFYILRHEPLDPSVPILLHIVGSSCNAYLVVVARHNIICTCSDTNPYCKHILFLIYDLGFPLIPGRQSLCFPSINGSLLHHKSKKQLDRVTNKMCLTLLANRCFHCKRTTSKSPAFICNHCFAVFHHRHAEVIVSSLCPCCRKQWLPSLSLCDGEHRNLYGILSAKGYELSHQCRTRVPVIHPSTKRDQLPVPHPPVMFPNVIPNPNSHVVPPSPPSSDFGELSQLL